MLTILLVLAIGDFGGTVVSISDGDTLWILLDEGGRVKVRPKGIDAPESDQPHGPESRVGLAHICLGKRVFVVDKGHDPYGRTLGLIFCDGIEVNTELVAMGHAWQDPRYSKSKLLKLAQQSARLLNRGLWAGEKPVEPWVWRREKRPQTPQP